MSWDWLSFFVGTLLGWLAQWLLDMGYWRKREDNAVISELMVEMERLRQENEQLRRGSRQFKRVGAAAGRIPHHPDGLQCRNRPAFGQPGAGD